MKHTTADDIKWLFSVTLAVMLFSVVLFVDHVKHVRRVKKHAGVRKLSDLYVNENGYLVRYHKKQKA